MHINLFKIKKVNSLNLRSIFSISIIPNIFIDILKHSYEKFALK